MSHDRHRITFDVFPHRSISNESTRKEPDMKTPIRALMFLAAVTVAAPAAAETFEVAAATSSTVRLAPFAPRACAEANWFSPPCMGRTSRIQLFMDWLTAASNLMTTSI